jgi:hypothetical protein
LQPKDRGQFDIQYLVELPDIRWKQAGHQIAPSWSTEMQMNYASNPDITYDHAYYIHFAIDTFVYRSLPKWLRTNAARRPHRSAETLEEAPRHLRQFHERLFQDEVPDEFIRRVSDTMRDCPQPTRSGSANSCRSLAGMRMMNRPN